jgi:hypothetical protein
VLSFNLSDFGGRFRIFQVVVNSIFWNPEVGFRTFQVFVNIIFRDSEVG